jgi:phosphatidate cytidylyltransferase
MAFNYQTFRTRTLTAIVFASVMLAGLLINAWTFLALVLVINAGSWWEFIQLSKKINFDTEKISKWVFIVSGLLFISISWACFIDINFSMQLQTALGNPSINWLPLILISCMWINDTMAYIVGSFIGKTPLSSVSPKKTWEGTIGGIALTVLVVGWLGHQYFNSFIYLEKPVNFPGFHWYLFAGIAAITGTLGDLLESKVKRMAGVKDSGNIMPGHGGFLDRFDSILLATPIIWLYLYLLS